ncbi:uncharacterized protein LOC132049022 [Lycium ferocissimum]|uniref:uncharacterized protein LOC132049022 n=1 Tax=Lycium ferocissimum TaxID=112874 RepID=UPI0028162AFF|nr:uncharacterized protein LOC132049022 [Lycium ferocissimum]
MNFFKSILSDDPDPQDPNIPEKDVAEVDPDHEKPDSTTGSDDVWSSFGGIFKTLSTRSESVLETYRKDLQEFGSGLKKETELLREVASREVGNTVSHVIKSTTEIISQGKDTLLAPDDNDVVEPETPDSGRVNPTRYSRFESQLVSIQSDPNTFCVGPEDLGEYEKWKSGFDLKEKSKEVELLIGENGCLESMYKRVVPNEVDNESFWFRYFYKVEKLKQQESVRAKLVKRAISIDDDDEELSWDVDDDDDEQESNVKSKVDGKGKEGSVIESSVDDVKKMGSDENRDSINVAKEVATDESESSKQDSTNVAKEEDSTNVAKEVAAGKSESSKEDSTNVAKEVATNKSEPSKVDSNSVAKEVPTNKSEPSKEDSTNVVKQATPSDESQTLSSAAVDKKEEDQSNSKDSKKEDTEVTSLSKKEEGVVKGSEGKGDNDESSKDGNVVIASSQKTGADEDDLDWAEIEDIEGNDDKKAATSHVASSNRADLRKRLSVEEDDEDLSWDIEDDD